MYAIIDCACLEIFKIMHCGPHIYMPYQHISMPAAHMSSESHTLWRGIIISVVTDTRTRPSSSVNLISFLCHIRCGVKSRSPCTYNHMKLASALTISDRYRSNTQHANSTSITKMGYWGMIVHRKRLRMWWLRAPLRETFWQTWFILCLIRAVSVRTCQ